MASEKTSPKMWRKVPQPKSRTGMSENYRSRFDR